MFVVHQPDIDKLEALEFRLSETESKLTIMDKTAAELLRQKESLTAENMELRQQLLQLSTVNQRLEHDIHKLKAWLPTY